MYLSHVINTDRCPAKIHTHRHTHNFAQLCGRCKGLWLEKQVVWHIWSHGAALHGFFDRGQTKVKVPRTQDKHTQLSSLAWLPYSPINAFLMLTRQSMLTHTSLLTGYLQPLELDMSVCVCVSVCVGVYVWCVSVCYVACVCVYVCVCGVSATVCVCLSVCVYVCVSLCCCVCGGVSVFVSVCVCGVSATVCVCLSVCVCESVLLCV